MIVLSNSNPDPFYKQIEDQIRVEIMNGRLKSGVRLPSVRALADQLNVSVITTKRAYDDLESEGIIVTRQGQGTYVAQVELERLLVEKVSEIRKDLYSLLEKAKEVSLPCEEIIGMIREWEARRDE
jgi:GntR family transcriptional regulator